MDHQGDIFIEFNAVLWLEICEFLLLINKKPVFHNKNLNKCGDKPVISNDAKCANLSFRDDFVQSLLPFPLNFFLEKLITGRRNLSPILIKELAQVFADRKIR